MEDYIQICAFGFVSGFALKMGYNIFISVVFAFLDILNKN